MSLTSHEQMTGFEGSGYSQDYRDLIQHRQNLEHTPVPTLDSGRSFYEELGEQNARFSTVGTNPNPEAGLFVTEVARRAKTAPDRLLENGDIDAEHEVRGAIRTIIARTVNYLVVPTEDADPNPRELLDTQGMTDEQVMAVKRETEAILGAMPGESGMTTVLPGTTLHYQRPDASDPDRIQIKIWRLHPSVRSDNESYLYTLPRDWTHPREERAAEPEQLPPLPEPMPSRRSVEYTASDLYTDLSETIRKLSRGGDHGYRLAGRLSDMAEQGVDKTDLLSQKEGGEARIAVNDGVLKAASLIDPIGENKDRRWDALFQSGNLDETSGTVTRELAMIFGAHSARRGVREMAGGSVETIVWKTEFPGFALVFEKLTKHDGSPETPVRVVLTKLQGK